jgi:hypothetical protein
MTGSIYCQHLHARELMMGLLQLHSYDSVANADYRAGQDAATIYAKSALQGIEEDALQLLNGADAGERVSRETLAATLSKAIAQGIEEELEEGAVDGLPQIADAAAKAVVVYLAETLSGRRFYVQPQRAEAPADDF